MPECQHSLVCKSQRVTKVEELKLFRRASAHVFHFAVVCLAGSSSPIRLVSHVQTIMFCQRLWLVHIVLCLWYTRHNHSIHKPTTKARHGWSAVGLRPRLAKPPCRRDRTHLWTQLGISGHISLRLHRSTQLLLGCLIFPFHLCRPFFSALTFLSLSNQLCWNISAQRGMCWKVASSQWCSCMCFSGKLEK